MSHRQKPLGDSLKMHLDGLAQSVSYYYARLLQQEIPEDVASDLVIDWHKGKIQSWVEKQKNDSPRQSEWV